MWGENQQPKNKILFFCRWEMDAFFLTWWLRPNHSFKNHNWHKEQLSHPPPPPNPEPYVSGDFTMSPRCMRCDCLLPGFLIYEVLYASTRRYYITDETIKHQLYRLLWLNRKKRTSQSTKVAGILVGTKMNRRKKVVRPTVGCERLVLELLR